MLEEYFPVCFDGMGAEILFLNHPESRMNMGLLSG
jgi:hypothetical protein